MGYLEKTAASFHVLGKERDQQFDPAFVTELLGVKPTHAHAIGGINPFIFERTGNRVPMKHAMWSIRVSRREPGDLDGQIMEIMDVLPDDTKTWDRINAEFKTRLFAGLWLDGFNSGEKLSGDTLLALGKRGIELDLDIYGDIDDNDEA